MRRIASLLDFTIRGSGLFGGMRLTKRMQEHLEHHSIDIHYFDFIAAFDFTIGLGRPILAVHEHTAPRLKFLAHDADLADQTFYA